MPCSAMYCDHGDEAGDARRAAAQRERHAAVLARPDLALRARRRRMNAPRALAAIAGHPAIDAVVMFGITIGSCSATSTCWPSPGALARQQRERDADGRLDAAVVVRHRHRAAHRRAIGVAGAEQVAARREDREVGAAPAGVRSVCPNGVIEHTTSRGLRACSASQPRPRAASAPGARGLEHDVGARREAEEELAAGGPRRGRASGCASTRCARARASGARDPARRRRTAAAAAPGRRAAARS